MTKPLHHQFEDDLGKLVDDYLLQGVEPADIVKVLKYEATHDHVARHLELIREQTQKSDEYSPTVKRVMARFDAEMDRLDKARTQ